MRTVAILFQLAVVLGSVGCATLPADVVRHGSLHNDRDSMPSGLATGLTRTLERHPGESGFWLLGDGLDAFAARILLAEAADRTIDVQYYLYHDDVTGRILTHHLLRAADRGVRVRVLLDDMTTRGIDKQLATLDEHPNVEVRIVNPYANRGFRGPETLARFDTVTRRMHNKSFSVDNLVTIVGGRNVGDEYYDAHEDVNFGDLDVLAVGPVAVNVGNQFDLYWNNQVAYPIGSLVDDPGDLDAVRHALQTYSDEQLDSPYARHVRQSELARDMANGTVDFQWGHALVYYDLPEKLVTDPEDRSTHMAPELLSSTFGALKRDILMFSPYFVPGEHGVIMLTDLEERGVEVRVLTNSLASTDVGVVHAGYAKYREPLLRGGVELFEFKPTADTAGRGKFDKFRGSSGASLHAKTSVFDRETLFVGSANLDPRSGKLNTEMGILFQSEPLAQGLDDWFEEHQAHIAYRVTLDQSQCENEQRCKGRLKWTDEEPGRQAVYFQDPGTGALRRFFISLVSLLPIEGQL